MLHATEYRMTEHKCDRTGQMPSKAFMRWTPEQEKISPHERINCKAGTVRAGLCRVRQRGNAYRSAFDVRENTKVVCVKFCKTGVAFSGDLGVSAAQLQCLAERRTWRPRLRRPMPLRPPERDCHQVARDVAGRRCRFRSATRW